MAAQGEFLRVTLNSIGDAVMTTDRDGLVMFMNPIAVAMTGWTEDDARGRPSIEVFRIVDESTRHVVESPIVRALQTGMVVGLSNHTLLIARDGTEHHIDDSAAPIRDVDGHTVGAVLVFHDVTHRRSLEAERERGAQRKDEFIAMLGHELRNPLSAIMNGVQLLQVMQPDAVATAQLPQVGDIVARMDRQGRHLIRLVDDLLDTARITTGKFSLHKTRLSLHQVISSAVEMCRSDLDARRIHLEVTSTNAPLEVNADGSRLAQVLVNLISNAIKYNVPGGQIRITAERRDHLAVITVVDDGIGISREALESIFELFVQADQSVSRTYGGLGVGLTVARSIMALHGGSVEAQSQGPGRGSTFTVHLPLATRDASAEPGTSEGRDGRNGDAPLRILVVDDNVDAGESLATLLRMSNHHVTMAIDGLSASRSAEAVRPDVTLLDLGLPDIDGYEVVRRMRAADATRSSLIIALTGYGGESDRQRTRDAGFDYHLTKPVDFKVLYQVIAARASLPRRPGRSDFDA